MNRASFRFYEELNDFLPAVRKKQDFSLEFQGNPSVKDIIESLGVPHPEVDLILINGESAEFSKKVYDGDMVSVYPVFESMDIAGVQRLRKEPLRETRFSLDVHLGKLLKYLRLLGFDAILDKDLDDKEIIEKAVQENRIILTRDKLLLRNKLVTHGYWIRSTSPQLQTVEVVRKFDLRGMMKPFTRCLECNSILEPVEKEEIEDKIPPRTRMFYNDFRICHGCDRIYWEGSHYQRMIGFVNRIHQCAVGTE